MTKTRFAALLVPLAIALAAVLAVTATPASGQNQDADATLDITVIWPDGSPAPDGVCVAYFAQFADDDFGFFASQHGSTQSFPVFSDSTYAVQVGGTCPPGTSTRIEPLVFVSDINPQPGVNPITITVGTATLSGTVSGRDGASCLVSATGRSDIAATSGPSTFSTRTNPDDSWELFVQPGEYNITTQCNLWGAFEAWPNSAFVADAEPVTVANEETRSGINFDVGDRLDDEIGLSIIFKTPETSDAVGCSEVYDAAGRLVDREIEPLGGPTYSARVSTNGDFRIRITDCFGLGFKDQWYPEGAAWASGPAFEVNGTRGEISIEADPLEFLDPLPEAATDAPGTCNGLAVTVDLAAGDQPTDDRDIILGTENDDVISAGRGNDVICGLGGNDTIEGGRGNDTILGGVGNDTIGGGRGNDTIFGQGGTDIALGGRGNDTIIGGSGDDNVQGKNGDDRIDGGKGNDTIRGGRHADVITGGNGQDTILGGKGPDMLFGNLGVDSYNGGGSNADACIADPFLLTEVRTACEP